MTVLADFSLPAEQFALSSSTARQRNICVDQRRESVIEVGITEQSKVPTLFAQSIVR